MDGDHFSKRTVFVAGGFNNTHRPTTLRERSGDSKVAAKVHESSNAKLFSNPLCGEVCRSSFGGSAEIEMNTFGQRDGQGGGVEDDPANPRGGPGEPWGTLGVSSKVVEITVVTQRDHCIGHRGVAGTIGVLRCPNCMGHEIKQQR